jgi:shikimate kinase
MSGKPHIIYIIGFMGSGKTTAGKALASRSGWSFIDLDKKIENHAGKSVPDIFSVHGEDYFRKLESEVLMHLKTYENTVVATGGGTPCYNENMEFMLNSGLTVYLQMTSEKLLKRLADSRGERPLVRNLKNGELLAFIEQKLAEREQYYERSRIIIDGSDPDINQLYLQVSAELGIPGK